MSFQVYPWPNVILHLDGDAFFASVMQAVRPELKGKPVVVGKERGIATAISYEAKALGIYRGMKLTDICRIFPQCRIIESDYETFSLFSQKMFNLVRLFSPRVEEYSVDEGFADLRGLRRPFKMSYFQLAAAIKKKIAASLGISVSIGVSCTKSLAKLASGSKKPGGLTIVDGLSIESFLAKIPVETVWGIGPATSAYLQKFNLVTALEFAQKPETFVRHYLSKPFLEIWHELRGDKIYELDCNPKTTYKGMAKTATFSPATNNPHLLWAKLSSNIEAAFDRLRKYHYQTGKLTIFLKTQDFRYHFTTIKLLEKTSFPILIRTPLKAAFLKIFKKNILYRATGCYLSELTDLTTTQLSFFSHLSGENKAKQIYSLLATKKVDFGTTLYDPEKIFKDKAPKKTIFPCLTFSQTI